MPQLCRHKVTGQSLTLGTLCISCEVLMHIISSHDTHKFASWTSVVTRKVNLLQQATTSLSVFLSFGGAWLALCSHSTAVQKDSLILRLYEARRGRKRESGVLNDISCHKEYMGPLGLCKLYHAVLGCQKASVRGQRVILCSISDTSLPGGSLWLCFTEFLLGSFIPSSFQPWVLTTMVVKVLEWS